MSDNIQTEVLTENSTESAPTIQTPSPVQMYGYMRKEKRPAERRDMKLAALLILPCLLLTNSLIYGGIGIVAAVSAVFLLITAFWYMGENKVRPSAYTVVSLCLAILLSAATVFSPEGLIKVLCLLIIAVLYIVILADLSGVRRYDAGTYKSVFDMISIFFTYGVEKLDEGCFALFRKKDAQGKVISRKTGNVFLGIALAVPALFVIVPLLVSSDAAFEGLLDNFLADSLWELIVTLLLGATAFLVAFSQLFTIKAAQPAKKKQTNFKGIDNVIIYSFLGVISAVYILYLISQLAYFFGGFSGLLPEDYTAAEYARRGFFEMCTVCAINLSIIFLTVIICRRKEGAVPAGIKAFSVFLGIFSMVLIGTAISKMVLYIGRFGMTRLRIYTSVFMVFLAIVIITVILTLYIRRIKYMKVIFITACLVLLVTCVADTDRIVANYNVNAYLSGKLETIDVDTLTELNSSAVKPLLTLYDNTEDETVKTQVRNELNRRFAEYYETEKNEVGNAVITKTNYDFRGFNIPEYSAVKALRDNVQSYYDAEYHENREIYGDYYYDDYYYDEEVEYY